MVLCLSFNLLIGEALEGYESYKPKKVYINVINATNPTKGYIEKRLQEMLLNEEIECLLDTENFPDVKQYGDDERLQFAMDSGADSAFIVWILDIDTRRGGWIDASSGDASGGGGTSIDDLAIIKFRVKLFSVQGDDPIWSETLTTRGRGGLHKGGLKNHAYMVAKASFKSLKKSGLIGGR